MTELAVEPSIGRALWRWQASTLIALLMGYTGYYLCRSNLAVAAPLLLADAGVGLDRQAIGVISSIGVLSYAVGKLVTGVAGDFIGGRRMFLAGLFGSVLATLAFGFSSSFAWLAGIWAVNRFFQSAGWGGLVKIASHWFPASRYGAVMAVLSLSFLFGDAVGRYFLGGLIAAGIGWRTLFFVAAGILGLIGIYELAALRSSPREVGLAEPNVSAGNLFGERGRSTTPGGLRDLLAAYRASPSLWLVCLISFGLTLIREAFNIWIPVYLVDERALSIADAAKYSSIFPFVGGLSTLAAGFWSDRMGDGNRIVVVLPCLTLCSFALAGLATVGDTAPLYVVLAAIANVAFWLLGPYSLLAGAMALELGGRQGSATAAGLIDTAGYLGAALSGYGVGRIVDRLGWPAAFQALAFVCGMTLVAAMAYWHQRRVVMA